MINILKKYYCASEPYIAKKRRKFFFFIAKCNNDTIFRKNTARRNHLLQKSAVKVRWSDIAVCCSLFLADVSVFFPQADQSLLPNSVHRVIANLLDSSKMQNLIAFRVNMAIFIWSIFIRAVIDHMTCYNLNWPKINLWAHYFVFSCALDHILKCIFQYFTRLDTF